MSPVLAKQDIEQLIKGQPPLVECYVNFAEQLQPNGFDLTLRAIAVPQTPGLIAVQNSQRRVSDLSPLVFDGLGAIDLIPGAYIITFNEVVHLPKDIMALGRPRSSLLRCGVTIGTAVWDAGYSGRSQALLVVHNPRGFRVENNARLLQLIFLQLSRETEGYQGVYQGENTGE
ncbi:MAG: deoxyuridine 5'-triphosphate nucleotidohydrolase [Chloroflexi bacterium]|nr:deoxyuridine 5'-triphosphate nucleotidohydrolase [Chloroflexota bacterium]